MLSFSATGPTPASEAPAGRRITLGVSLKMYLGARQTLEWCREVATLARRHPTIGKGIELFVLPSAPMIPPVLELLAGTAIGVGAQDLHTADAGAFTGEVSGAMLAELGCRYAEVGHAERRRLFGEDDATVAAKVAAAQRSSLLPVLCVGEPAEGPAEQAAARCVSELRTLFGHGPGVIAYEPHWAIGQADAAPLSHIAAVSAALRAALEDRDCPVIYGGSAGPGLLTDLGDAVDGLFLGRFAHDPRALEEIVEEAEQSISTPTPSTVGGPR